MKQSSAIHFRSHKCARTTCQNTFTGGFLTQITESNGTSRYSGQKAILQCNEQSFVKVATSEMILNGHLTNTTRVVCKYQGRLPIWVDEVTDEGVICDKECVQDEDCSQKDLGFCFDHRY